MISLDKAKSLISVEELKFEPDKCHYVRHLQLSSFIRCRSDLGFYSFTTQFQL